MTPTHIVVRRSESDHSDVIRAPIFGSGLLCFANTCALFTLRQLSVWQKQRTVVFQPVYHTIMIMDTAAVAPISNPTIPVDNVKVHILLMMSISKLQESVEGGPLAVDDESGNLLLRQETIIFIQNAVHRFRMWLDYLTVSPSPEKEPIPPLDVLMIWHAYMLSPSVYYRDSGIEFPVLKTLGGMPWNKIAACIEDDATFFTGSSSSGQIQEWEKTTSVPFNRKIVNYNDLQASDSPSFSIDLVAAVLRQSLSLMNMLAEIKWHCDHALDEWINNAIIRYSQFMRLPEGDYVPPVDVDIIWHTHQLSGPKYWDETLFFFGDHIDHNDDITPQAAHDGRELMRSYVPMLQPTYLNEDGVGPGSGPGSGGPGGGGSGGGGSGGGSGPEPRCGGSRGGCRRR